MVPKTHSKRLKMSVTHSNKLATSQGCSTVLAPVSHRPTLLAFLIPFAVLLAYALASYPMMYPGFDVWIHLMAIEFNSRRDAIWYSLLRWLFATFDLHGPFEQARLVHVLQVTLSGILVFFGARWILKVADQQNLCSPARLSWLAWFSVLIWFLMHGSVDAG